MRTSSWLLLGFLSTAVTLDTTASRAQTRAAVPKPIQTDALTTKAKELFDEGLAAFLESRWADAHASFLAAWKLSPRYQIAGNLGTTEIMLGKHRDAAEHLSWYLHEAPASKEQERRQVEGHLKETLAHVAAIAVELAPAGAEVSVDGEVVGKAPLALPVFLEPGEHEIAARRDGYVAARRRVTARAGAADSLSMRLEPVRVPEPARAPDVHGGPNKALIYSGLAVTGVAAGAGVVFGVLSLQREGDADDRRVALMKDGGEYACSGGQRAAECNAYAEARNDAWTFTKVSWIGFGGAAVAGAATWLYHWTATSMVDKGTARVQATPLISTSGGGIVMTGAW
jgi:PEGA domain